MPTNITLAQAADPMTAGFKLLVASLKANAAFVAANSRFQDWSDGTSTKSLDALLPADVPETTIVQGAFTLKPYGRNSTVAEIIQTYTLVAVTGSLQVAKANAMKWSFAGAIYHADLENALWNGNPFVSDLMIGNGADGTTGLALPGVPGGAARGVDRIVSVAAVTLTLYCPRSSLPT